MLVSRTCSLGKVATPPPDTLACQLITWPSRWPDPLAVSGHWPVSERKSSRADTIPEMAREDTLATDHLAVGMVEAGMTVGDAVR